MPDPIVNLQGSRPDLVTPAPNSTTANGGVNTGADPLSMLRDSVLGTKPPTTEPNVFYSPTEIDTTGRYPWYVPGADNEETYAQGQGVLSKAAHGIWKGLNLAGTTFAQGTAGAINGVYQMIKDERVASFYDNEFNQSLDKWNKDLENSMPNYYTARERDANWYEPANLFTANFLFDKVIKNMGFSVGAIASGFAWSKALSLLPKLSELAVSGYTAETANALEETIPTVNAAQRVAKADETIRGISNGVNQAQRFNFLNQGQRATVAGFATIGEAGMEASNNLNEFRNQLIAQYKTENGVRPSGAALDKINEMSDHVGNWSFGMNIALLSATNYIQLPKILNSSYQAEKAAANSIATSAIVKDAETGLFKSSLASKGFAKRLQQAKGIGEFFFAPSEAFEEGAQQTIQEGTENYWNKKNRGEQANFVDDVLGYGANRTLSTKEGLESILIGGLSGGLMMARGNYREKGLTGYGGELRANTDAAIAAFNSVGFSKFTRDTVDSVNRGITLQEQREAAIRQGDVLESKDLEHDYIHNYLTPRLKYGRYDLVKQDLGSMQRLASTTDGFAQLQQQGIVNENDTQQSFLARLESLSKTADNVNSLYKSLNSRYSGLLNKEGERAYPEATIDKMVYAASKIADYDTRIPQLNDVLGASGILVSDTNNVEDIKKAVEQINSLPVVSTVKDALKDSLRDLLELNLRRNHFLTEYDKMKKNPSQYGEIVAPIDLSEDIKIQQDGKEVALKAGDTFSAKDSIIMDNGKIQVFPKIEVQGKNIIGEVKAKLPDGSVRYVSPKELEGYNLSDTNNFDPKLEEKLNTALGEDSFLGQKLGTTLASKIQDINNTNNPAKIAKAFKILKNLIDEYNAVKQKADEATKNLKTIEKVEKDQQEEDLGAGIITLDPSTPISMVEDSGSKKKSIRKLFASTTSPSKDLKPHHEREQSLLNNAKNFSNRGKMKLMLVTANTAKALGLEGMFDRLGNVADTIAAVYVIEDKGKKSFIDADGNLIGDVGTQTNVDKAVFTVMPTNSLTWENGERRFHGVDDAEAKKYADSWEKKRKEILSWTGDTHVSFPFKISRGIAKTIEQNGVTQQNPVVGSLINQSDLFKQGLVTVSTTDNVLHNEESIGIPVGSVVLTNQDTLQFLNSRKFNPEEVDHLANVLHQFIKEAQSSGINKRLSRYLQGVLHFGSPKEGQAPAKNQIWFSKGQFHLGSNLSFPFTTESFSANEDNVKAFLSNAYHNVNNSKLSGDNFNKPFEEIIDVDLNGKIGSITWVSYQHYLLSTKHDLVTDDPSPLREATRKNIVLTTSVRPINTAVNPLDSNFEQKYATLSGEVYTLPEKVEKKAPAKKEASTPIVKSGYTLDGKTENSYTFKAGEVKFKGTLDAEGKLVISNIKGAPIKTIAEGPNYATAVLGTLKAAGVEADEDAETNVSNWMALAIAKAYAAEKAPEQGPTLADKKAGLTPEDAAKKTFTEAILAAHETGVDSKFDWTVTSKVTTADKKKGAASIRAGKPNAAGKRLQEEIDEMYTKGSVTINRGRGNQAVTTEIPIAQWLAGPGEEAQSAPTTEQEDQKRQEAADMLKAAKETGWKPVDDSPFREIIEQNQVVKANLDKEQTWFESRFNIPFNRVQNVIRMTNGGAAYGKFQDAAVYIWENAEIGTTYHEAFEAVWSMFTSPIERKSIIREFKNRTGLFTDRVTGEKLLYAEATEHQAKEQIAEEFRDFILNGTQKKGLLQRMFADLLNWIKNVIFGKTHNIGDMFKRINNGYYKTAAPVNHETLAPQYRAIEGFTEKISRSVAEGVTARLFQELFKSGRSLVEFDNHEVSVGELYQKVYDGLKQFYTVQIPIQLEKDEEARIRYNEIWKNIDRNWEHVKNANDELLKTFGILTQRDNQNTEELDNPENVSERAANDEASRTEYERNPFLYDFKKNAPASIKLLFATLTETVATANTAMPEIDRDKATMLERLANSSKLFNQSLSELGGFNTMDEKQEKLMDLFPSAPNLVRLYNRLKFNEDPSTITSEEWKLRVNWFNVMSKQHPQGIINYIDEAGNSHSESANLNDAPKTQVKLWLENLKQSVGKKGSFISLDKDKKNYVFSGDALKSMKIKEPEDKSRFLSTLGINFTVELYNTLKPAQKTQFNKAVESLHKYLGLNQNVAAVNGKSLNVNGPLSTISQIYVRAGGQEWDSTYFNISGERIQQFILPNYVSNIVNDLNNSSSVAEIGRRLPHLLNKPFSQASLFLKNNSLLFYPEGARTGDNIDIKYIQGTIDASRTRPNVPTDKLNAAQRLVQEINQNLNGNYFVLVPADSKTEWMLSLGNTVGMAEFDNPGLVWAKIYRIFNDYYQVEKEMSKDGKKRLLADLSNDYKDDNINEKLKDFIASMVNEQRTFLEDFNVIEHGEEWNIHGLDSGFKLNNFQGKNAEEINQLLTFRTVNYMINNTEMHKLFFGDPAAYSDATKRYKSFLSPRESSLYGNSGWNNHANEYYNKGLQQGDFGFHSFKDHMVVNVLNDVTSSNEILSNDANLDPSVRKAYTETNGTDGQSWGTLTGYREIWMRAARWRDSHEQQYQYQMALDRSLLAEDGLLPNYRPELKAADDAILAKGNPRVAVFPVLKPIGSGVTTEGNPFLHKTSLVPLFYSALRGRNMAQHYIKMMNQGVSYSIVISGEKVGNQGQDELYNEDGSPNPEDLKTLVEIPFRYYGIQVETNSSKDQQTMGSQLTKLALVNLLDVGKPIDTALTHEEWEALTPAKKLAESKIYRAVKENHDLLKEMTRIGYNKLLNKLGITDNNGSYTIKDKTKVAKLLQDELLRREVADNIKDALALNPETGEFNVALEAIPNYIQIKSVLYSFVDKYIASPKLNGGPKVQVSGSMWEKIGAREIVDKSGKKRVVSSHLKFFKATYAEDGKTVTKVAAMEVMLPNWIAKQLRRKGVTLTDEEIIAKMSPDMLNGVGFRIPTQELNSATAFIIKGFLPEEMGDTVIVPEEITTQGGSDFDIDKLNTYLKNIHVTNTGELHLVEYKGSESETRAYYNKFFDDAIEEAKKTTQKKLENNEWKKNLIGDFEAGLLDEKTIDKYADKINDIIGDVEDPLDIVQNLMDRAVKLGKKLDQLNDAEWLQIRKEIFVDRMYEQSIQNEYFNSLQRIILNPLNFKRLVSPNSSQELKDLRTELNGVLGITGGKNKSILNPMFMSETRHNFIVGKGGVGLAAVQQTNNALNQLGNVYIDPENLRKLPDDVKAVLGTAHIALPHNKTSIAGKLFATLSNIRDQAGEYISGKISMYIDGYVDIAKDPFIVEIGATPMLAPTFMFLEKIGVPTSTVVFFMNQPIIREYVKQMNADQQTWLFNDERQKEVMLMFPTTNQLIEQTVSINTDDLKGNISDFYKNGQLSATKNAEQRFILQEFLKYAMMSNQLFQITQGSNYDTANFNDPNLIHKKQYATEQARKGNLFTSVDALLDNSHIGNTAKTLIKTRDAIGETLIKMETPAARLTLDRVKNDMLQRYISDQDYLKIARRIEENLLSYLLQTKRTLNTSLQKLMINLETSVASKLYSLQEQARQNPDSDIAKNAFLMATYASLGKTEGATKNIRLSTSVTNALTANMFTGALRELKGFDPELYSQITRLALLQSGISKSPLSFSELIPYEDYTRAINPLLTYLENPSETANFVDTDGFYRNNWADKTIIPTVKDKFQFNGLDSHNQPMYKTNRFHNATWVNSLLFRNGMDKEYYMPYKIFSKRQEAKSKFITIRRVVLGATNKAAIELAKKGDFSLYETVLLKRLEYTDGKPYENTYRKPTGEPNDKHLTYYVYYPVNAWGDGMRAQEFYETPRQTVFENGTYKPSKEFTNAEILDAITTIPQAPANRPKAIVKEAPIAPKLTQAEKTALAREKAKAILASAKTDGTINQKCN